MIRNLLKAANALTFSTMFLLLLAGCNKNTIIFEDGTTPNGSSNDGPWNSTLVTQRLRGGPEPITFHVSHE